MTGPQILIASIIIVFVIAFVITMLFVNSQTKKIIDVNNKLAESQNALLNQNKTQTDLLEKLEGEPFTLPKEHLPEGRTQDKQGLWPIESMGKKRR